MDRLQAVSFHLITVLPKYHAIKLHKEVIHMKFGEKLKQLRTEKKLTQAEVAKAVGISLRTYAAIHASVSCMASWQRNSAVIPITC